jgi:hypothetical protein
MTTKQRILSTLIIVLIAVSLLACYSTACLTNDELLKWLDTGTPQPCYSGR